MTFKVGDRVEARWYGGAGQTWRLARVLSLPAHAGDLHHVEIDGLSRYRGDDELRAISQPETYAVGDEVEIFWNNAWHPARVIASFGPTIGVPVEYSGDRYVWHPDEVRRPQRTAQQLAAWVAERDNAPPMTSLGYENVPALRPPPSPSRCPRCHGPRDAEPRAHLHLCGCLVKWDAPSPDYVGQGCHYEPNGRSNGETVWIAEGRGVAASHPLRDSAVALWRERVSR